MPVQNAFEHYSVTNPPNPIYLCFRYKPTIPAAWGWRKTAPKSCLVCYCLLWKKFTHWLLNYLVWIAVTGRILFKLECSSDPARWFLHWTRALWEGQQTEVNLFAGFWAYFCEVLILSRPLSNGVMVHLYTSLISAAAQGW